MNEYMHYQEYFKSFLGGWSFEGGDRTLTIKLVTEQEMFDAETQRKKKNLCLIFEEEPLPMVLNVTNAETIAKVTGTDVMSDWIGRKIILGQSDIKAFGKVHKAIRVRNQQPDEKTYICEGCGQVIKYALKKQPSELAEISKRNCGKILCLECMKKYKADQEKGEKNAEQN